MKKKIILLVLVLVLVIILLLFLALCIIFIKAENKNSVATVATLDENLIINEFYDPEYNENYIKNINVINLTNSNIKNSYQFVYMADLQASIIDENETDELIRTNLIQRNSMFYADNDSSQVRNIFNEIINYSNNKNATALLLGGDIIDSPSDSNFRFLKENLNNLKIPYLYALGNHDWSFGWDYHTQNAKNVQYPKFEEIMDDVQVSYLEYKDCIVLAINDSEDSISEESVEKIKNVLDKQKPTIVMLHVPISTEYISSEAIRIRNRISAIGEGGITPTESTQKALDMILSNEYQVFYVIAGHVHFAIEDNLNEKIVENVTAPAYEGVINVIKINN
jgi:Icc-related predicted phosphoesterase